MSGDNKAVLLDEAVGHYVVHRGFYGYDGIVQTYVASGKRAALSWADDEGYSREVRDCGTQCFPGDPSSQSRQAG